MNEANELVEFDKIAAGIADIQEKGNFIPDTSTKEGYEASKRFVLDETTPARTRLDKAHKAAKEYWKKGGQNVDSKKNEIMNILLDIQKPHQDAYKAFDQAEKDKKAKFESDIRDKINAIYHYRTLPPNATSSVISDLIQSCGETDTAEGFYKWTDEAVKTRAESLESLNESLMAAVSYEAEQQRQAELAEENRLRQIEIDKQQEAMRLQQEEMDRKQAEIDEANRQVELKAQAEAEEKQRAINEAKQIERDRLAAIERERYAKEQAELAAKAATEIEQQRQYDERIRLEAEQAKLEADKKHTGMVRGEIKTHLMSTCDIDEATAIKVVKALLKTTRVTINY